MHPDSRFVVNGSSVCHGAHRHSSDAVERFVPAINIYAPKPMWKGGTLFGQLLSRAERRK